VDSPELSIRRAWELCYLDPLQAGEIGRQVAEQGGPMAAEGWWHAALAESRLGEAQLATAALQHARRGFAARADARGLALCDEVQAILLRRAGAYRDAAQLLATLDTRGGVERDPMHQFISCNSRAITAKLLGQHDEALRQFYAASDWAARTGWLGPRITALSNLGGHQQDLYNLEDARIMTEQALSLAREAGARQVVTTAAANLVIIYHAAGALDQARAMVEFLKTHSEDLVPGALKRYALMLALGHLGVGEIDQALEHLAEGAVAGVGDGDGRVQWAWLKARCLLARGDAAGARSVAGDTLQQRHAEMLSEQPYDTMSLLRALADACEAEGDAVAGLRYMRQAHAMYEELVGRSARARYIALQVAHELAEAQRERDLAMDSQRSVEDDRRRLVELNAALQAQVAETEMLHTKLREQALRDPLTGLHNRRYLFEIAPGLLELARRQGSTVCVVLIDLDHFKLLNDTYGHQAGDLVLQRFSALMTQVLRRSDVVCRHGGEEFVAIMPDIDTQGAEVVINRLLEAYQSQQIEMGRRRLPRRSFSAGIAVFPRNGHTLELLLSRADRGLYAAKHQGRARVEFAPGTGFGTLM
jgi:diguanylate cyclase (GGDEF)-like protein